MPEGHTGRVRDEQEGGVRVESSHPAPSQRPRAKEATRRRPAAAATAVAGPGLPPVPRPARPVDRARVQGGEERQRLLRARVCV